MKYEIFKRVSVDQEHYNDQNTEHMCHINITVQDIHCGRLGVQ